LSNLALKRNLFSVHIGTITHVLAISGQHVVVLAALIYFSLASARSGDLLGNG
jgi:hypothetical protein